MKDRRQIRRLGTSLFIRFFSNRAQGTKSEGFTQDVSLGGARLLSLKKPRLHESIELSIDVPNNPDLTLAEGSVRWIGAKKEKDEIGREVIPIGVEFTYIDHQDKVYLEEFLSMQKPI